MTSWPHHQVWFKSLNQCILYFPSIYPFPPTISAISYVMCRVLCSCYKSLTGCSIWRHASPAWCNTAAQRPATCSAGCKFKFIIFVSYRSLSWHAPRDQSSGPATCRGRCSVECGSKKHFYAQQLEVLNCSMRCENNIFDRRRNCAIVTIAVNWAAGSLTRPVSDVWQCLEDANTAPIR